MMPPRSPPRGSESGSPRWHRLHAHTAPSAGRRAQLPYPPRNAKESIPIPYRRLVRPVPPFPELTPNPLRLDQDELICIAALFLDRVLRLHLPPLRSRGLLCPELSFCRQRGRKMMGRSMPPTPVLSWAFWEAAGKRIRRLECRLGVLLFHSCGRSGFWGCFCQNTSKASVFLSKHQSSVGISFSLTLEHAPFVPNHSCASVSPFR